VHSCRSGNCCADLEARCCDGGTVSVENAVPNVECSRVYVLRAGSILNEVFLRVRLIQMIGGPIEKRDGAYEIGAKAAGHSRPSCSWGESIARAKEQRKIAESY